MLTNHLLAGASYLTGIHSERKHVCEVGIVCNYPKHQTHTADNLHTFADRHTHTHTKHLALKHVNPGKSRCSLGHVQVLAHNTNQTPPHSHACTLLSHSSAVHAQCAGGTGPDVASQTSLEVRPRRSGGPLGREKPFPPWSGVVVVRGRMLSAERNS